MCKLVKSTFLMRGEIHSNSSVVLEVELLATSDETSAASSNETTLLTAGSVSSDGGGVTNVLMVTTTMGMLDGVHSNTSHSGPVLSLSLGLEVGVGSLEDGLVSSLATGDDADHSSAATHDGLSDTGGELDTGLLAILGVTDDDGRGAGGTGETSTVTDLGLNVGDDGAFWHLVHGHHIADSEGGFVTSVDELSGVHALDGDEVLSALLVLVLISENHFSKGSTTSRVVHDVLDDSLGVTFPLSEV